MPRFRMTTRVLVLAGAAVVAASTWAAMSRQARESPISAVTPAISGQAKAQTTAIEGTVVHASPARQSHVEAYVVRGGHARFDFNHRALEGLNLWFVARGAIDEAGGGQRVSFNVESSSTLQLAATADVFSKIVGGRVHTSGAFLLDRAGDRAVIGNLTIGMDDHGGYTVRDTLSRDRGGFVAFDMKSVMVDFLPVTQELRILGELSINQMWAEELGMPDAAGAEIGTLLIDGVAAPEEAIDAGPGYAREPAEDAVRTARSIGPDVVVADLQDIGYYGREGSIHAYSVATHACNFGDERASWVAGTNDHPVIAANMYRLKDDRFEEIGMSWVKHGFYAVSWDFCDLGCPDPTNGTELGVGCSDPYDANLNGQQSNMSLRSDVNAHTGYFPYPWEAPDPPPVIGKRLQVHADDLRPTANPGAVYFVQGHYINADDAVAGNADNNASYRLVTVEQPSMYEFTVTPSGETQLRQPGIRAWQDTDPTVTETDIRVPDEGLFILAAKAVDLGTGWWRYSYALQNLNSDRSGRSFSMPVSGTLGVTNIGFHDVDYHSGEIYDLTDWPGTVDNGAITWSTESFESNENANALRFSTLYNFYFDAMVEPEPTTVTLGLFKPGVPMEVPAPSIGPMCLAPPRAELGGPACLIPRNCLSEWSGADCVRGFCYIPKNRYLTIEPATNSAPVAYQVELTEATNYPAAVGRTWWVNEPECYDYPDGNVVPGAVECEGQDFFGWVSKLTSTAVTRTWTESPLHLTGCGIVPLVTYEIRASADEGQTFSDSLEIATVHAPSLPQYWGDLTGGPEVVDPPSGRWLPPDGSMNMGDVQAAIKTFENSTEDTGFPPRIWVDVEINQVVNLGDVQFLLMAFEGKLYADINLPLIGVDPANCP